MRRTPLIQKRPPDRSGEPGYRQWHEPIWGACAICGRRGRLVRHHVILEQHIRRIDSSRVWDLRASLPIGVWCPDRCHARHHAAFARLPARSLTAENLAFMVELLGEDRTADYIARFYTP